MSNASDRNPQDIINIRESVLLYKRITINGREVRLPPHRITKINRYLRNKSNTKWPPDKPHSDKAGICLLMDPSSKEAEHLDSSNALAKISPNYKRRSCNLQQRNKTDHQEAKAIP